jgi:hypothetical protein
MRLDFGVRSQQSRANLSASKHSAREARYELLHCRGDRADNGDAFCAGLDASFGSGLGGQRPGAAMHRPRPLFRRIAICADQHLVCRSNARGNATERQRIRNDAAGYHAVAGGPSPARPDVSAALRPCQSRPSAPDVAGRGANGVLSIEAPLNISASAHLNLGASGFYEIPIFGAPAPPRFQMPF